MRPVQGKARITEAGLVQALIQMSLAARLQAVSADLPPQDGLEVVVQLVAHTLWQGRLPLTLFGDQILDWWRDLAVLANFQPRARLLSGPHTLPKVVTLRDLGPDGHQRCHIRKSGQVLLCIHPLYCGGGNKEETKQWVMTRVATACLAQGVDLSQTTDFVGHLVEAVGVPKLVMLLNENSEGSLWDALRDAAKSRDVTLPEAAAGLVKAETRIKRAANKVKPQHRRLTASDLSPDPGFFQNADGTQAVFLDNLTPGASGILVVDPPQVPELVATLQGVQPDELALLVVGTSCDLPPGAIEVSFPALAGTPPSKVDCRTNVTWAAKQSQSSTGPKPTLKCKTQAVVSSSCFVMSLMLSSGSRCVRPQ